MKEKTAKPILTVAQRRTLREQRSRVPAQVQAAFETALKAWKETWFGGGLAISSDPHTRTVGKEFDALVALGPEILPLVIEALADPENFFVLQLYDAIQPDPRLIVQYGPEDERILEESRDGRAGPSRLGSRTDDLARVQTGSRLLEIVASPGPPHHPRNSFPAHSRTHRIQAS